MNSQSCFDIFLKKHQSNLLIKETQVDSLLNKCNNSIKDKIDIVDFFSVYYYRKKKINLAIKYIQREIDYYDTIGNKDFSYEYALYNKARFHYYNNEFDDALVYYKKVINLNNNTLKQASLIGIGKSYREKGDFYKAEDYFIKATRSHKKENSPITLYKSYLYSINNYKLINTEESILSSKRLLNKLEKLIKQEKKLQTPTRYFTFNFAKGNSFSSLLKLNYNKSDSLKKFYFKKSSYFFKKALKHAKQNKDSSRISLANINLGSIYITQKKDSALYFLNNSLKYNSKNSYNKALIYNNIADFYFSQKKTKLAIVNIQKAININFNIDENQKEFTPTDLQLYINNNKKNTILYLNNKANILIDLHSLTKNDLYLKKAIKTVKISDRLVDLIINSSDELKSKFIWREEASKSYLLGVKASHLLKNHKTMFYFMEKNRAILLIESVNRNTNQSNLPKGTINKLNHFNRKILELEDFIKKEIKPNNNTTFRDSLFRLKAQYKVFNDSLKKSHPSAFNKHIKIKKLNNINLGKKSDSFIISYIANNINIETEAMFGLTIYKNHTFSFEIKNIKEFKKNLENYKKLISKPLETKNKIKKFKKAAFYLYDNLIPSDDLKNEIKSKNLIIIPDITFENIPFEALSTNKFKLEYLIKSSNISYTYSISFLEHNKRVNRKNNTTISLFAPVNFNSKKLSSLEYTQKETKNIHEIINGNLYKYSRASKQNFLNKTSTSKIIHLATHASASNNPSIQFYDEELKLHELYTYKNNADLVVLSACETNLGAIKKGEGVLNLTRGFFYSGANTVVSSLWNVNDQSTSSIMTNFYKNLKKGKSKSLALTNAKREYLKNHSLSENSPYYWASFVLIGDDGEINLTNYNHLYILLLGVILAGILFFLCKKKKKRG